MSTRRTILLGAELALTGLTIAVAISLERLFTDLSFLRELLILVIGSHVVAAVCRRAGLSMAWATPLSGLALVILGTAAFYPDASAHVIPTSQTLTILGEDLREAWRIFSDDAAPVPPIRGFIVTTSVLVWYCVFLADWAAFRLRSPLEAIAPATSVFVSGSLLGDGRNEIAHGLLFAVGLLAVLLTMRAERQAREEVWVAGGTTDGVRSTLQLGSAVGLVAVVLGGLIAPRIPGATAQPLVDITGINNDSETRSVLSPLVELSTSLFNRSEVELFSVHVDRGERDYWRLMALTKFEDEIWRRSSNFDEVRGPVGSDLGASVPTRTITQEIEIAALGNIYLPAAYEVSNVVDDGGINLEYEVATGALVVEHGLEHIPRGLSYTIESQVPDFVADDLPADATSGRDRGFVSEHTQLPPECRPGESTASTGCWPTGVTELAKRIVGDAGATTDHDRVLALQGFFLDPAEFTYNLNVALEHDITDMNTFLRVRKGYCEQFASTFAAMARSLGIPARIAVGFTWGEWDPTRQAYVVSGKHAHAWTEIHFAGVGWVIFDPTPGRSRGHDADITGLQQPEQIGSNTLEEPRPDPAAPDDAAPLDNDSRVAPGTTVPVDEEPTVVGVPVGDSGGGPPWRLLLAPIAVIAVLGFVPTLQYWRRRLRLTAVAFDPVGRGEMAWDDAMGALRLLGINAPGDRTPHELASVVERSMREPGPVRVLADHVTRLRYSAQVDKTEDAIAAQDAAAEIVRNCRSLVGRRRVLREALDPRTLLQPAPMPTVLR